MRQLRPPPPLARPLARLALLPAWTRWKRTETSQQPQRSPAAQPRPQETKQQRHSVTRDHDYDNGAHISPSTSTPAVPAVPDEKNLPLNVPTTRAVGSGETDRANRSRTSDGGSDSVSRTVGLCRAGGVEMRLAQALDDASADKNIPGGGSTAGFQKLPRRNFARAEGGMEPNIPAVKETGWVETQFTADERCEQDEGHKGATGLSVPLAGCGGEEGLSTGGDKEILWRQRQALLRK